MAKKGWNKYFDSTFFFELQTEHLFDIFYVKYFLSILDQIKVKKSLT